MGATKKAGYVVTCPAFTTKPVPTREAAERVLANITAAGNCREAHEIREAPMGRP